MESKFKISVLAASVVMGLGFTGVALAADGDASKKDEAKKSEAQQPAEKIAVGTSTLVTAKAAFTPGSTLAAAAADDLLKAYNKISTGLEKQTAGEKISLGYNAKTALDEWVTDRAAVREADLPTYNSFLNFENGQSFKAVQDAASGLKTTSETAKTAADGRIKTSLTGLFGTAVTGDSPVLGFKESAATTAVIDAAYSADNIAKLINPVAATIGGTEVAVADAAYVKNNGALSAYVSKTKDVYDKAVAAIANIDKSGDKSVSGAAAETKANGYKTRIDNLGKVLAYQEGAEQWYKAAQNVASNNQALTDDFQRQITGLVGADVLQANAPEPAKVMGAAVTAASSEADRKTNLKHALWEYGQAYTAANPETPESAAIDVAKIEAAGKKYKALITAAKLMDEFKAGGDYAELATKVEAINTAYDLAVSNAVKYLGKVANTDVTGEKIGADLAAKYAPLLDTGSTKLVKLDTALIDKTQDALLLVDPETKELKGALGELINLIKDTPNTDSAMDATGTSLKKVMEKALGTPVNGATAATGWYKDKDDLYAARSNVANLYTTLEQAIKDSGMAHVDLLGATHKLNELKKNTTLFNLATLVNDPTTTDKVAKALAARVDYDAKINALESAADLVIAVAQESQNRAIAAYKNVLEGTGTEGVTAASTFAALVDNSRALIHGTDTAQVKGGLTAALLAKANVTELKRQAINADFGELATGLTKVDTAKEEVVTDKAAFVEKFNAYKQKWLALKDLAALDPGRAAATTARDEALTELLTAASTWNGTAKVKADNTDDAFVTAMGTINSSTKAEDVLTLLNSNATNRLAAYTKLAAAESGVTNHTSNLESGLAIDRDLANHAEFLGSFQPYENSADSVGELRRQYKEIIKVLASRDDNGSLLTGDAAKSLTFDQQKTLAEKGPRTLYLGGLTAEQAGKIDGTGHFARLHGVDAQGNLKTTFTPDDLYTGTKEKPIHGTVFSVMAPQVSMNFGEENKITVGGTAKDNRMQVFASTSHYKAADVDKDTTKGLRGILPAANLANNSGAAVEITGNLKTGTVVNGLPPSQFGTGGLSDGVAINGWTGTAQANVTAVGQDHVVLQHMDITNTITKDTLKGNGVQLKTTTTPDNLGIGLLISSNGVNSQLTNQATGYKFGQILTQQQVMGNISKPGITLNDVHILVDNQVAGGDARAVSLSGSGNHIEIKDSLIEAKTISVKNSLSHESGGQGQTLDENDTHTIKKGKEIALYFGDKSVNNRLDISNTIIRGDIVDERTTDAQVQKDQDGNALTNQVTITGGSLTGDVRSPSSAALKNNILKLVLDGASWTGSSSNSPDLDMKNGAVWHVKDNLVIDQNGNPVELDDSSVNFLNVYGTGNVIDLTANDGKGVVSNSGTGGYTAVNVNVEQDLVMHQNAMLTVNAQAVDKKSAELAGGPSDANVYNRGTLHVEHLILGDSATAPARLAFNLKNSGSEPLTVQGRLASVSNDLINESRLVLQPYDFATWKTQETRGGVVVKSNVVVVPTVAEVGVWQYEAKAEPSFRVDINGDKVDNTDLINQSSVYFVNNNKLSNSAATVAALAASPASIASMESDALAKHMNSLRHSDSSGVWISYYGGSNKNRLNVGTDYNLKTNGVMLGVDTQLANKWLAGVAFTSAKSSLNTMQSTGDVNSYGAQFYLSRRYENGVFVDANAQFGHFSNRASARMLDGYISRGDYSGNGYGLGVKLGYAYQNQGFFAEPYVRATGRAFTGASYILNGMNVNSTDYKSVLGEIGADLGFHVPMNTGYFKPYLHLAVLDEFANGNHVRVNNIDLNNSINGAAFQVGIGAEVQVMKNFGGYVSYDYTTGSGIERPWQATVGVNYTW